MTIKQCTGCGAYFDTINEALEHDCPNKVESDEPEPLADGGQLDWPLTINGHTLAKTHSPSLSSQQVTCADCGAQTRYTVHDIGIDTTPERLVQHLLGRLPDRCPGPEPSRTEVEP